MNDLEFPMPGQANSQSKRKNSSKITKSSRKNSKSVPIGPKSEVDKISECKEMLDKTESSNEEKLKLIMENEQIRAVF